MQRKLLLLLVFVFLLFKTPPVHGFYFLGEVKGLDCGIAGNTGGGDKCCSDTVLTPTLVSALGSILSRIPSGIPFISEIQDLGKAINGTQTEYGKSPRCVTGREVSSATGCVCAYSVTARSPKKISTLCSQYLTSKSIQGQRELANCLSCTNRGTGNEYFYSGLGCVPLSFGRLINEYIFKYGIGIAGVIAFLCILYNALRIQLSQGQTEKMKKATDNIKSCLMGLALILFATFILRVIGVDILRIPGLL